MAWPPTLVAYKADQNITDATRDVAHQQMLDAAVAIVERIRSDLNFLADPLVDKPAVTADVVLGTIRLAGRLYMRRDTPQGLIQMGEAGVVRIASYDPDIERLLQIGRYRGGLFA